MQQRDHDREQSTGEEIANSIVHGLGVLLALAATPILIILAIKNGDAIDIVAVSLFVTCMLLLYLASTLYHALPEGRGKRVFKIFDHSAIYLLIAGTYTPFVLGVLGGWVGWTLFGVVWGLAIFGIVFKSVWGARQDWFSTSLYVLMGWLIVFAIKPLWHSLPHHGFYWLVAGGLAYTLGVIFFVLDHKFKFSHFIWHLFVLAGTVCHCVAIGRYAIGN